MPQEMRCHDRIHARLIRDEVIDSDIAPITRWEVKCRSKACGARSGVIVLHYFDTETLELIETKIRKEPAMAFSSNKKEA